MVEQNELTVVIPTRNEGSNIKNMLNEVSKYVFLDQVLVVDDSDKRDHHMTEIIAKFKGARFMEGQHKGLGRAIVDGIKACDSDFIVVLDADLSHPPSAIPDMIEACRNGYDMAIGSRYCFGGDIVGWTKRRRLISLVASGLGFPITRLRDNTSGYFCFRRSILDGHNIEPTSWKIMLEVLVKTGARAKEVPITFKDREAGESKFTTKEVFAYLKHLFKLAMFKWRVLNFMCVGGIGYVINMVAYSLFLYFPPRDFQPIPSRAELESTIFLGQHFYLPAFLFSSLVAIVFNYKMNKVWTFGDRKANSQSFLRYLSMASVTLLFDMFVLFLLVDYGKLAPILGAGIAIAVVFVIRYFIAKHWVWSGK